MLNASLERISFRYSASNGDDLTVFRELSASLPFRGVTGLIGRSGVGKTTLCRLLSGRLKPQAGSIVWKNRGSTCANPQIGFLSQSSELAPWLRVDELWQLVSRRDGQRFRTRVPDLLFELVTQKQRSLTRDLSGGEGRRVEIALVLGAGAELIILDEPYQNVDSPSARILTEDLLALSEQQDTHYLVVTHDIHLLSTFTFPVLMLEGPSKISEVTETDTSKRLACFWTALRPVGK